MDTQKIVIIVLILIIVVFVIFVARGSLTADEKAIANVTPPDWSETINRIFGGLQESVVLECKEKSSPNTDRKCETLPLGVTQIKPAKDPWLPFLKKTTFRTVKLVLISGQAEITYINSKKNSKIKNPDKSPLPNFNNKKPNIESLVITEDGGMLTILCKANASCQVGQQ